MRFQSEPQYLMSSEPMYTPSFLPMSFIPSMYPSQDQLKAIIVCRNGQVHL
jgi:hypothetical protein